VTDNKNRRYIRDPFRYLLIIKRGSLKGIVKANSKKNVRKKKKRMIGLESTFFVNITRYCDIYGRKGFNLLTTRLFGGEFDILNIKYANKKNVT
jgi:hypothetical protein